MGRPIRKYTKSQGETGQEKLLYAQTILFFIGALLALTGSSIAVYVAAKNLKKAEQTSIQEPEPFII